MSGEERQHTAQGALRAEERLKHGSYLVRLQELGHVSHGSRHKRRWDDHEDDL